MGGGGGGGGGGMADSFVTLSKRISSKPSLLFLEAVLPRKAGQTPLLTGNNSESFRS